MILGFTGTRKEPTAEQKQFIMRHVQQAEVAHHGCCVGSDHAFHRCAVALGAPTIWLHPPTDQKLMVPMADLLTVPGIHALTPKPYHDRNRDIVDECDMLIATPDGPRRPHSGTWYTIDYAKRCKVPVAICRPDGTIDPLSYED